MPAMVPAQTESAVQRPCEVRLTDAATISAAAYGFAPPRNFDIVARYPHDRHAFTQGLAFYRGDLYESTGLRGRSSVRRVELKSGRVLKTRHLNAKLFGEGLAVVDHHLIQLTWQSGTAFIYSPTDLKRSGGFNYPGEGWGITGLVGRLAISDGTSQLTFIDAKNYRHMGRLSVSDGGRPVAGLNELETVGESILANVYPSDCIAQIDPQSGRVLAWIDVSGLLPLAERADGSAVANGIAYNPETGELFVTGKFWPYIYQLKLKPTGSVKNSRTAPVPVTG